MRTGRFARKTKLAAFFTLIVAGAWIVLIFHPVFSAWLDKQNAAGELNYVSEIIPSIPVAHAGVTQESKYEAKIEELKNSVLDRLAKCESGGKKEEDGITILDTNNVGSYGPFQFQRKTVMFYEEKRTGKPINGRDAIILALQGDKARELASWIIFETKAGVAQDWVNCDRANGLQKEVDLIKRLTS